jgi:hypothetical protein
VEIPVKRSNRTTHPVGLLPARGAFGGALRGAFRPTNTAASGTPFLLLRSPQDATPAAMATTGIPRPQPVGEHGALPPRAVPGTAP